jgi:hypothetical protein
MKQARCCGNCAKGIKMGINNDILCRTKGVVSRDFVCSKYKVSPAAWTGSERKPKCIECEFFINSENGDLSSATGYCQLFTVRYYNGEQKSACSKFSKRSFSHTYTALAK